MSARKFFAELFGNKNQIEITTEVDDERRRLSISKSGRFRQKNTAHRIEIQEDTYTPQDTTPEPGEEKDQKKTSRSNTERKLAERIKRQESTI